MTRLAVILVTWLALLFGYWTGLGGVALTGMYPRTNSGAGTFLVVLGVTGCISFVLICLRPLRAQILSGAIFFVGWLPMMGVVTEEVARRH